MSSSHGSVLLISLLNTCSSTFAPLLLLSQGGSSYLQTRNRLDNAIFDIVTQITSLVELKLAHNQLSGDVPANIQELTALEVLELQNNSLTGFVGSLHTLSQLRIVNLSCNKLKAAPFTLLNGQSLIELQVASNGLAGSLLPSGHDYPRLRVLDASNNALTSVLDDADTAPSLPSLHTLNLSGNRLSFLPELSGCPELRALLLEGNQLDSLPESFYSLSSLRQADLTGNNFRRLDQRLATMGALQLLGIAANPLLDRKYLTMATPNVKSDLQARMERDLS